jgi:hypothetical protein
MNMAKRLFSLAALAAILAASAASQGGTYVGTSAANFLKIGLGARAVGMGESDITMAGDASAFYWNPGAISRIGNPSVTFSASQWFASTNLAYLSVSMPFSFGTAAMDVSYFSSGDIEETTLQRQDGTGRVINANDIAIGLGYARDLTDRFSVGLKVKYIREQLAAVSAGTFAFDIGSIFTTTFVNDLKIGIVLSNFGGALRFDGRDLLVTHVVPGSPTGKQIPAVLQTTDWPLPLLFRIGIATDIVRSEDVTVTTAYTVSDSRDYGDRHNLGAAVTLVRMFTLRGGYRFKYDEATFSAGAGVLLTTGTVGTVSFDYAYTDFGKLKGVHQFTLGLLLD